MQSRLVHSQTVWNLGWDHLWWEDPDLFYFFPLGIELQQLFLAAPIPHPSGEVQLFELLLCWRHYCSVYTIFWLRTLPSFQAPSPLLSRPRTSPSYLGRWRRDKTPRPNLTILMPMPNLGLHRLAWGPHREINDTSPALLSGQLDNLPLRLGATSFAPWLRVLGQVTKSFGPRTTTTNSR